MLGNCSWEVIGHHSPRQLALSLNGATAKQEHLFLCDYTVNTSKGTGCGLMQLVTWEEFHMERILLCGSEIREKRKLLLWLWHKRPLCPPYLFLFLICNHFLTDIHVACLFYKLPDAYISSWWGCALWAWSWVCAPGHPANRSHKACCRPVWPRLICHDVCVLGVC